MKIDIYVFAASMIFACSAIAADSYPTRPIRVIDPFSPGGSTDAQARTIGAKLTAAWGQPVVIDSRPGAGSAIGSQLVARSAPDGYSLLFNNAAFATVPSLSKKPPYDPLKDFAPVILVSTQPQIVVAHPSLPGTLKEVLSYAKANPGKLNFSSSGIGGGSHLSMEYLKSVAGVNIVHVPYKGSSPAATAIMAGEMQLGAFSANAVLPHIKSGTLRALAVTGPARSVALPHLLTTAEAGLLGFEVVQWGAMFAPAGTPSKVVEKLNRQINMILRMPDVKDHLARLGVEPAGSSPSQLADFVASEVRKWSKVITDAGIPRE